MKRPAHPLAAALATTLAVGALGGGLLGPTTPASAATTCGDPANPIHGWGAVDAAVGTTKVVTVDLDLWVEDGCGVEQAVATFVGPHRKTYEVPLTAQVEVGGDVRWSGSLRLDPRALSDADAGSWEVAYRVTGADVDSTARAVALVRRATRVSFDAGPEPVRNGRITFSGTVERASWTSKRYKTVSKPVVVRRHEDDGDAEIVVTRVTSRSDGTYRQTVRFRGATTTYWADFDGGAVSAPKRSRLDTVVAR